MQQLLCRSTRLVRFLGNICRPTCVFFLRLLALSSLQPPFLLGRSGRITALIFGNNLFLFLFSLWRSQSGEDVPQDGLVHFDVEVFRFYAPEHSAGDPTELHTTTWCEWREVYFQVFRYQKSIVLSRLPELGHRLVLLDICQHVTAQQGSAGIISSVCIHVPKHVYKIPQAKTKPYMWHTNVFYKPTRSQCVWDWVALLPCVRPPDHVEVICQTLRMSVLGLASHQKTQGRIKLGESYVGPASMLLGLRKPSALVNRDLVHRRDVDGARAPIISIAILLIMAIIIASSCHCKCRPDRFQHGLGLCIIWSNRCLGIYPLQRCADYINNITSCNAFSLV